MSMMSSDVETVRAALSLANRAPSIHNSQPWRWRVGDRGIQLHAQRGFPPAQADPGSRDLLVSCGAALNHCAVALTALGRPPKIHRFPTPGDPSHLASFELNRHGPTDVDIALAAAIPRLRNDRRRFSAWPVSLGDVALMGARAARHGVTMRRFEPSTAFSTSLDELALCSGQQVPAPAGLFAAATLTTPVDDNGVLLALGTGADDALGRLRAGEATSVVVLTATALGLSSCLLTEPLDIPDTRAGVASEVFAAELFPQMVLRIGWAPVDADPLPAAPRRPLEEVVSWSDERT